MSLFSKLFSWVQRFKKKPPTEYYTDYLRPLPYNWIPGDGIMIDSSFTLETINEANYKECEVNLTKPHDDLKKDYPTERIEWQPVKITVPSWGDEREFE